MRYKITKLSGWGNYPVVETHLYRPEKLRDLKNLIGEESWIARGLGRSYGDAAINEKGGTLLFTRLNRFLDFDENTGILYAEAGISLDEIENICTQGMVFTGNDGDKICYIGRRNCQ